MIIKKKGKFYFLHNKLEFEGEYLYDKKWNGKGFDIDGKLIYELNNGNGKFIEYDNNGKKLFEGEYLEGVKHGKGKEYFEDFGILSFDGE